VLDPRLLRVGIEVNGKLNVYDGLAITAQGYKSGSPVQNECNITIANLDKPTRDFLLTEGSPYNKIRTQKRSKIIVEAGRESFGYFVLYKGDIVSVGLTQPPDITVNIRALTGNFFKGSIVSNTSKPNTPLSTIAQQVADDMGLSLQFNVAVDKLVSNWNYTGAAEKQIQKLYYLGNYDAYIDDDKLVVNDRSKTIKNSIRRLSKETGLLGIPEFSDNGVKVKFFIDNYTRVGSLLRLDSDIYPAVNGDYKIVKLAFDAANRDTPFYYIADATRI
jgi:hypothetical protein